MKILLQRLSDGGDSTVGALFVNGRLAAWTLEDEYRVKKVKNETRIPEGVYPLHLRTEGRFHADYSRRFAGMHVGMLCLDPVPGFQFILIHIGNVDEHTSGCILVGKKANLNIEEAGRLEESTEAYKAFYPPVAQHLKRNGAGSAVLTIRDEYHLFGGAR